MPKPPGAGRVLAGMLGGGLCGYFTYWAGAFLQAIPDLKQQDPTTLQTTFLRPVQVVTSWEVALVLAGIVIGGAVAKYLWKAAGLLSYIGLASLIVGYFSYSISVSIPSVPPSERWLSYILLVAEGGGLGLIVVFSFYSLDAATRRRWNRRADLVPWDPNLRPKVCFQVPVYNEPFEMVQQTVAHLVRQDYPAGSFMVVVADDSTDERNRARLAAYCKEVGAIHVARPKRGGFKAGALNYVTRMLPPEIELIAVIDADYWVQTDYLKSIVGHFIDPRLSFVQTPQDYRNADESFLTRQYKRAEAYFYHAIMPSRNEQNAIIFCGTMGILRRTALEQVGGFAEDQICEDAEVSVRLAAAGWGSLYVDRSFGKGLMPAVFDAYKKQFHRWAFGNVRIFFSRFGMIVRGRMSRRQKLDFLVSNLHWFDGFFVTAIACVLLALGLGPSFGYDVVTHHQKEIALLALVPIFLLVDGVVRLHLVLRKGSRIKLRQSLLVQGMWFAIKFTNMTAVVKCMLGFRTPFVRTPKDPGRRLGRIRSFFRSIWIAKIETLFAAALWTASVLNWQSVWPGLRENPATGLLPFWLGLYGLFFACAPIYAYLSYRTLKPMRYEMVPVAHSGSVQWA